MGDKLAPSRLALAPGAAMRDLGAVVTISTVPVDLMICNVVNNQAAIAWIQLFDTTGAVTLGTTLPDFEFQVGANLTLPLPLSASGLRFNYGLKVASTTGEKGATPSAAGVQPFFGIQ